MDLRAVLKDLTETFASERIEYALPIGYIHRAALDRIELLVDGNRATDVDRILVERGYRALYREPEIADYVTDGTSRGHVRCFFARDQGARALCRRASPRRLAAGFDAHATDEQVRAGSGSRESERRVREWERSQPHNLDSLLEWTDQLRSVFGSPPVDLEPWRGDDFRL